MLIQLGDLHPGSLSSRVGSQPKDKPIVRPQSASPFGVMGTERDSRRYTVS